MRHNQTALYRARIRIVEATYVRPAETTEVYLVHAESWQSRTHHLTPKREEEEKLREHGQNELRIGFAVGAVVAIPIVLLTFYILDNFAQQVALIVLCLLGAAIVSLGIVFLLSKGIARRISGVGASIDVESTLTDIGAGLHAISEGRSADAKAQIEKASKGVVFWIGWLQSRRIIIYLLLGALGLLAGSASTFIIIRQNNILERQSKIFDAQSALLRDTLLASESQKYGPLYGQLADVLAAIAKESGARGELAAYQLVELSPELTQQIVFLTHSFRPYYYFDTDANFERNSDSGISDLPMVFLSPERGQILRAILENRAELHQDFEEMDRASANFRYSDMRGTRVWGAHIGDLWSIGAIDYTGDCGTAATRYTMFAPNQIDEFEFTPLGEAYEYYAPPPPQAVRLYARDLRQYDLAYSDFSGADINGVKFDFSYGSAKFRNSTLTSVSLSQSYGSDTIIDLSGATAIGITYDGAVPSWPEINESSVNWIIPKCDPQFAASEILKEPEAESE